MATNENRKKHKKQYDYYPQSSIYESDYYRNKRLVLAGETFRSGRRTGPEKSPSHYRGRF